MAEDMPATDPRGQFTDRELAAHRRRSLSTTGMKAMLTQAKASPALALDPDVLDGDPYALCTPAGVVDLHTGHLRKPDPDTRLPLPGHQRRPRADAHPALAPLPRRHLRRRRRRRRR